MVQPAKTLEQIEAMRQGGKILAEILQGIREYAKPGMSEIEVNDWVEAEIRRRGATPTYFEPVPNFPAAICISTNEQIVHSVPSEYVFVSGDLVGFDLVITYGGMKVDAAFTMSIGKPPKAAAKHLLNITERSLYAGIDAIKGRGTHTGDIGAAIEDVLSAGKLGIVRELVGHGVGNEMHMEPEVPNYGRKGSGVVLSPGDTIAIEPMATLGTGKVKHDSSDGWTISSADDTLTAHFEHTVLITETGAEILTQVK